MYGNENCESIVYGQIRFEVGIESARQAGIDLAKVLIEKLKEEEKYE